MSRYKYSKTPRFLETECARRGYGISRDEERSLWTISAPGSSRLVHRNGRTEFEVNRKPDLELTDYDFDRLSRRAITRRLDRLA